MIHPLRVRFEEMRIKIPASLPHLEALTEELTGYEMKVNQKMAYWSMSNKFAQRALRLI